MSRVTISVTSDSDTCLALRKSVFIDEQGFPEDVDEYDDIAIHLLAQQDGRPVAAARVVVDEDTAKIGRVCVVPDMRGTGLGAEMIRAALDVARDLPGVSTARLSAQVRAMGFYEKLGFEAEGQPHDDLGVPHQMMAQDL